MSSVPVLETGDRVSTSTKPGIWRDFQSAEAKSTPPINRRHPQVTRVRFLGTLCTSKKGERDDH